MSKRITWKGGFGSVLLWSVISAAFIGPGTVTTAANAGSLFGTQLLWALLFLRWQLSYYKKVLSD